MLPREMLLCLCLLLLYPDITSAETGVQRLVKKTPNTVVAVSATCSLDTMTARIAMTRPFHGVLYARGFPLECRAQGSGRNEAEIQLQTSACGVRAEPAKNGGLTYMVTLQVQTDRFLQQISDQEQIITCHLPEEKMIINSSTTVLTANPPQSKTNVRAGRMHSENTKTDTNKQVASQLGHVMAWMEISGTTDSMKHSQVTVGERTTLLIKSRIPEGIGSKVTDCVAHDGVGDTSQKLLDDAGCPIDEFILPALQDVTESFLLTDGHHQKDGEGPGTRLQIAGATFSAFKFPDRSSLHLRCTLQLCRDRCIHVDCDDSIAKQYNSSRHTRRLKGQAGEVLQRFDVFNSVEVMAPGIELDRPEMPYSADFREFTPNMNYPPVHGDRAFCLSPPKMALAFGVLGLIFLCAVAVAMYTLLRSRRQPWYRGKLLLNEETLMVQDSPFLGMSSRHQWPYVRVVH